MGSTKVSAGLDTKFTIFRFSIILMLRMLISYFIVAIFCCICIISFGGLTEDGNLTPPKDFQAEKTTFSNYTAVDNFDDLRVELAESWHRRELLLLYTSLNVEYDAYFDLYGAWVDEMLNPAKFLVINIGRLMSESNGTSPPFGQEYFKTLGSIITPNVIVMVVTHGEIVMNYAFLNDITVRNYDRPPVNVIILNHEQPWVPDDHSRRDNTLVLNSQLVPAYKSLGLVIRSYYYRRLNDVSFYLPLGPQRYRSIVGNMSHPIMKGLKPLSQRSHNCVFAGRFLYVEDSALHAERWEMKELMTSGRLSCAILWKEQMNLENKHTIAYDDYVAIMADSIFLPCPAGNNPETFRHYEALELGAIPLIVVGKADGETWTGKKEVQDRQNGRGENETKVRRGDINFLEYWEGYPGPLLESWEEAQSVMTALVSTPAVLDKLQRRLQNWYKSFKGLTRQRMALIIQGRMDINAQSERKTRRFEQTVIEV